MKLSPNFDLEEFSKDGPIPEGCLPVLVDLCMEILEPVRAQAKMALMITSGYRPPEANAEAHGQPNSEHIYTPMWAAVDFSPKYTEQTRAIFDWMRNNSELPYHQLILEHGENFSVIHVSINKRMPGIRSVLEGATHNSEPYKKVDHVEFSV